LQDFPLLLQQPILAAEAGQFRPLFGGQPGLLTRVNGGALHPRAQGLDIDPQIAGDLQQRCLARAHQAHRFRAEFRRVRRLRHGHPSVNLLLAYLSA
jgi:hypothetical protein